MSIQADSVNEDLGTVLELDGISLEMYEDFRDAFQHLRENQGEFSGFFEGEVKRTVEEMFHGVVGDLLRKTDLDPEGGEPHRNTCLRDDGTIDVYCKTVEVLPGEDTSISGYRTGYAPELTFEVDQPDSIEVTSELKREGKHMIDVIHDALVYPGADGMDDPITEMDSHGNIRIASIEQIPTFVEDARDVAQAIGKESLSELYKLRKDAEYADRPEVSQELGDKYRRRLWDELGANIPV